MSPSEIRVNEVSSAIIAEHIDSAQMRMLFGGIEMIKAKCRVLNVKRVTVELARLFVKKVDERLKPLNKEEREKVLWRLYYRYPILRDVLRAAHSRPSKLVL